MKRRIAAILVADIVGYSALMAADEEETAGRLAGWRERIDAEVGKCDGRVFKAMGDAVLVEFASPINAVRCAVNVRSALALAEQAEQQPLRMRFGLHLADVLIENDDLIGDGVNLAARIQQAAEPDAIDISAALFEQIRRNSPFTFDDRGDQNFRNIAEPIRVYRLRDEIGRHVYQIAPTQAAPIREKRPHSIAVMPIDAVSGDEDRKYLADGVTEELILELSRFKKLFVVSRSATADHDRTGTHAHRQGISDHARCLDRGAARDRGRDRRIERPVCGQS
jgi:adenylate cyclase